MKRISFLCAEGLDTFINPIIQELDKDDEFVCHKFQMAGEITEKLRKAVQWGDIIWFEWANELAKFGTDPEICPAIMDRKVIVRLHSYEALTNMPAHVNWKAVDKLIYVAHHIREIINAYLPDSKINETVENLVIPNGVDLKKHKLIKRNDQRLVNIAYVGYINNKKNPPMALQIMHKLPPKFLLHIAGTFQDRRYEVYMKHMIIEMGLGERVHFHGWIDNMPKWYQDKTILLSTSVHEGHSYCIIEAMAKGIIPVVHNFYGAKEQYPPEILFNSVTQAVDRIEVAGKADTGRWLREYVIQKGWAFSNQMKQIKGVINELAK